MLRTIRSRMLLAALLPVTLVVVAVVGAFWASRLGDLDEAHQQRAKLLVRQVALASEYGVFSGNTASLQAVVNAVLREPDVRAVAVFDANGAMLASAGTPAFTSYGSLQDSVYIAQQHNRGVDTLTESINLSNVQLDDLFANQGTDKFSPSTHLGHAVLEISRGGLAARERDLLSIALLVGLLGLSLGGFLALRLGEGVVHPILQVSKTIGRIGRGSFSPHRPLNPKDPLFELQAGLRQMAIRLAWGRDELEQQVTAVTQELRLKKEEAENATLAKSRFLAAASHDLRQPTHALGMFVARLEQLTLDAQTRELVGNLQASVQSMQDLLDGLLDLSRLESGAVQVQLARISIGSLFNGLQAALAPIAADKNLRLHIRPSDAWAHTDAILLQRIVMNLAQNALRYTEAGTVLISCRRVDAGQNLRIEVWDSGIGISPEHQTEIFKEFYQVGNSARGRAYGLGLGLNIVERSAQLLGHTVCIRSGLGCGTRISVTLPMAEPPDTMTTVLPEVIAVQDNRGLRVLVLEDDDFAREAVQELLATWGYGVRAVASVGQAMDLVREGFVPDIIVSDYRLGDGENGLMAIHGLRALAQSEIPACLMSGDTDGVLMQAAKDANLTLLHKPVRPAKLRSLLRRLAPLTESEAGAAAPQQDA
ncbi:ATP-binding protein [Rhodoferax saidenbachensis]|uniref:histidine kinase n=1 Tax=Rhodoferax saidenbachensis TaxID=1484693 RepID=A0A1P8K8U0_9BURK|nr:ATP-binding protein [Rhodoferax saidenbachensis]APW42399.1 hybrid sensor histidine kinase/response regulator [Rhodoferax saidenbachensis]